jgi:hypothetical protein
LGINTPQILPKKPRAKAKPKAKARGKSKAKKKAAPEPEEPEWVPPPLDPLVQEMQALYDKYQEQADNLQEQKDQRETLLENLDMRQKTLAKNRKAMLESQGNIVKEFEHERDLERLGFEK